MTEFDVVVIGAGAARMMCAIEAGKRGRRVLVVEHAKAAGEKIRISGGGRCNFTNLNTKFENFLGQNPRFAISALRRYRPRDFIAWIERHHIAWHEKTLGQLFCDGSAREIIDMLLSEMREAGVTWRLSTTVEGIEKTEAGFQLATTGGAVACDALVIATGGKSIPKMGATGFGYDVARQFSVKVTETRPALVPLTFEVGLPERLSPRWVNSMASSNRVLPLAIRASTATPTRGFSRSRRPISKVRGTRAGRVGVTGTSNWRATS